MAGMESILTDEKDKIENTIKATESWIEKLDMIEKTLSFSLQYLKSRISRACED